MFIQSSPLNLLKKRWKVILLSGIILAVLSGFVCLLFPLEYRADAQVLIISKSRYGVDPYTVVKSAERVGENLTQVMKSNDFYNKVMNQPGYNLDKGIFNNIEERLKRKKWNKTVNTSVIYGTGVLNISAYHTDKSQAKEYAGAVAGTLSSQAWQYVGGDVTLKVINDPVVTPWPVRPNIVVNIIVAFMIGLVLSSFVFLKRS